MSALRPGKLRSIAALLAIVASSSMLVLTFLPIPPSPDSAVHSAIGHALAAQTLALAQPGAPIILLRPDTSEFPRPAFDLIIRAFQKQLHRAGAVPPTVRTFELDPLRPTEVAPGDFVELLRKSPPGTVIVSLLGPPLLSGEQRRQLGTVRAKVVAFCSVPGRVNPGALFRQGLLHAAVAANPPANNSSRAATPGDFDHLYSVLDSSKLAAFDAAPLTQPSP